MQRTFHATVKPFVGGLNTELSQVEETPQYTADELNCRTYPGGTRGRRYGMGIEQNGSTLYKDDEAIYSVYYWSNAGNSGIDLLVTQVGGKLVFKRAIKPFSSQNNFATVDLTSYIINTVSFQSSQMSYTTGAGYLIVANEFMDTLLIKYNPIEETVTAIKPSFKVRDFEGFQEDIAVDERPTELTPAHQYNLMNQGWTVAQIEKFKQDSGDNTYPSNNLVWFVGKDSTGAFDPTILLTKYFGNTPAPKGHYVLDALVKNRYALSGLFPGASVKSHYEWVQGGARNNSKRRSWGGAKEPQTGDKISFDFSDNPGKLLSFFLAFRYSGSVFDYMPVGDVGNPFKFKLEGFNPSSNQWETLFNWTSVACDSSGTYNFSKVFEGNTTYYTSLRLSADADTNRVCAGEFRISTSVGEWNAATSSAYNYRIKDVNFLAGHFFYLLNNRLLFSQTVTENIDNFNKCYQDADPTSEEVSDLIDTDGGEIIFTALGKGVGLSKSTLGMLVFGDSGTYAVISSTAGNFSATSYTTQYVNGSGCHSKDSIVETEGAVYYWSPVGIMRISENTTTGISLLTENITSQTIQTFYQSIPISCRERCRGVYDACNSLIYWYYPSDTDEDNIYAYDSCLVYSTELNSFYPYHLGTQGHVCTPFQLPKPTEIVPEVLLYVGDNIVAAGESDIIVKELEQTFQETTQLEHLSKLFIEGYYIQGDEVWSADGQQIGEIVDGTYVKPVKYRIDRASEDITITPYIGSIVDQAPDINFEYAILGKCISGETPNSWIDHVSDGGDLAYGLLYDSVWKNTIPALFSISVGFRYFSDIEGFYNISFEGLVDGEWQNIQGLGGIIEKDAGYQTFKIVCNQYDDSKEHQAFEDFRVKVSCSGEYAVYKIDWSIGLLRDTSTISVEGGTLAYTEYNSRDFLDWNFSNFDSYMVSFPIITTDTLNYKQVPIVQTIFTRTEEETLKDGKYLAPSDCQYRIRWSWSIGDQSNRWDTLQKCYFVPDNYKNFKYLTSKIVVRGRGKAFQIELRSIDNKDMRIAGINTLIRGE